MFTELFKSIFPIKFLVGGKRTAKKSRFNQKRRKTQRNVRNTKRIRKINRKINRKRIIKRIINGGNSNTNNNTTNITPNNKHLTIKRIPLSKYKKSKKYKRRNRLK